MKFLLIFLLLFSTQLYAKSEKFECSMNGTLKYGEDQGSYVVLKSTPLESLPVELHLNAEEGIMGSQDIIWTNPKGVVLDDHLNINNETFHFRVGIHYIGSTDKYTFDVTIVKQTGHTSTAPRVSMLKEYDKNTDKFEGIINLKPWWFTTHQVNGSNITATVRCIRL